MSGSEAKISVEILADGFVETVNDRWSEGGCGDQRSRRWSEMDATAQTAVGGVLASFMPHVLCKQDWGCVLGGRSPLKGRERERETWCCNRFPWSTLHILLWRGNGFDLFKLRGRIGFVNFR
jgi:hypothetical protein